MGLKVSVVAFKQHNWTVENEINIIRQLSSVEFYYLESNREIFLPATISVLFEKAGRLVTKLFPGLFFAGMGVSRRSWLLYNWCRNTTCKPGLVIAHNPAAFYPACWLAAKQQIPFALDIEDYHPGEGRDEAAKRVSTIVMKKLMPQAAYNSFAAPLIREYSAKLVADNKGNFITINNVFSKTEFTNTTTGSNKKLTFAWFSQFVDYGRGLEKILPVLDKYKDIIELTLIGSRRDGFYEKEIQPRHYITVIGSLPQHELNLQLSMYDIGLAIEDAGSDMNRDICLTNKIWAYFQSGLYILASDTKAQLQFIQQHPEHGVTVSLTPEKLEAAINELLQSKQNIQQDHTSRFDKAASFNWENESTVLKEKWEALLQ